MLFAKWVGAVVEADCGGLSFSDQFAEAADGIAMADDESTIEWSEATVEGLQAFAEEVLAVGSGPRVIVQPVGGEIDWDDW